MFKSIVTIFRGHAAEAEEALVDANAMTILDQQIRDCATAIETTRRTLALAIAQERQEEARLEKLSARREALEGRAGEALDGGNEDLAMEAAGMIASMETEYADATASLARHKLETERLRSLVKTGQTRLTELEQGRRSARKTAAVLKLRDVQTGTSVSFQSTLRDAETTLNRLKQRQGDLDAAAQALDELDAETSPASIEDKLAAAGFGPPTRTQARDVLDRLKAAREGTAGTAPAKSK